ncbi:myrosinase 1-like [Melitaea cinxia]|uniref:myrosinase 1-like n=1 Tax=Melitaea cinxia TaxID=113334 RepID=UPI001E271BB3|nr:myrosinase 1-like [Melitaea cinxia]
MKFPSSFRFGAASSAIQIEGGWNADGKGESTWDRVIHNERRIVKNNATADVAAYSYHQWREDVRIAAELGLQFYRFSISWPRILPTGFTDKLNHAGVQYYSDLIDALLAEGIEPIVTMYHWDLPVKIQDLGGWTNPLIVNWFGDYARTLYSHYAGRVKTWITLNEAISFCDLAYIVGAFAPRIKEPVFAPYLCNKHVLLAHATAYRIYEKEFKPKYNARFTIANYEIWIEPKTPEDTELAELGREFSSGRYAHAILSKEGGWPPAVEKLMLEYSLKQGFNVSRLPSFTKEEKEFIKGTADFYGINHYTTNVIRPAKPGEDPGVWVVTGSPELNAVLELPPNTKASPGPFPLLVVSAYFIFTRHYFQVYPEGIRRLLSWIKQKYGDIDIMIVENGLTSKKSGPYDNDRVDFIKRYLEQVLLSIKVDNVSVVGYTVWSLTDNFEWLDGYTTKFGLYEVDFEDPKRIRTPRTSAYYYACAIKHRTFDVPDECFDPEYVRHHFKIRDKQNGGVALQNGRLFLYSLLLISIIISY